MKAKFFYEKALQLYPKSEQLQQDLKDAEKGISKKMSSFKLSEWKFPETLLPFCEKSGSNQRLESKNYQKKQRTRKLSSKMETRIRMVGLYIFSSNLWWFGLFLFTNWWNLWKIYSHTNRNEIWWWRNKVRISEFWMLVDLMGMIEDKKITGKNLEKKNELFKYDKSKSFWNIVYQWSTKFIFWNLSFGSKITKIAIWTICLLFYSQFFVVNEILFQEKQEYEEILKSFTREWKLTKWK